MLLSPGHFAASNIRGLYFPFIRGPGIRLPYCRERPAVTCGNKSQPGVWMNPYQLQGTAFFERTYNNLRYASNNYREKKETQQKQSIQYRTAQHHFNDSRVAPWGGAPLDYILLI